MASPLDPLCTFRPLTGEVTCLKHSKLSLSEAGLISGSRTGSFHLWSLSTKRCVWTENTGSSIVNVGTCYGDGNSGIISQTRNNTVSIWDITHQKRVRSMDIDDFGFCRFCTLDHSFKWKSCIALPSQESYKVNVYDILSGKPEQCFHTRDFKSYGMCMCICSLSSESGIDYLLSGFENGSVILWDERNTSSELCSCQLFSQPVLSMTVDGISKGAAGSADNLIKCFDVCLEKGTVTVCHSLNVKNCGISDVAVRQDRKIFATGGWDGRIRVFTWLTGKPVAVINYHSQTINCVHFAGVNAFDDPTSNTLMCGSKDGTISVWKLY